MGEPFMVLTWDEHPRAGLCLIVLGPVRAWQRELLGRFGVSSLAARAVALLFPPVLPEVSRGSFHPSPLLGSLLVTQCDTFPYFLF